MSLEQQQLEAAIEALEAQRPVLGDAVVESLLAPARARLAALAASPERPAEMEQQLKQVSILFLDVVGSTTLSQRLDPEAISAVMDDALARGTAVVEAHRGKVLQYAGDNILAVFGAEGAREDDAEHAVQCGLALLELGKSLGAEVWATHGHATFNVRVGIHTGGVLLGGGVDAEGTIRGIAVNIAARMEQTAPSGALRISHDTYALVRGLFEVDVMEPLSVKGVDAPVRSYLVRRAKPRNFRIRTRGIEGVPTQMIGRDAELSALQSAFLHLFAERKLAAVTVVADAGVGKSRLLDEFDAWSDARPETFFLFRGRATPQTDTQAFGLLRDILARRFQIADDDSVEAARQKMEDGVVPLFLHDEGPDLAQAHAHLLGHLIGIEWKSSRHIKGILDDPRQIRNRAWHAAAQLFRKLSATDGSPVVLQLEDLHWADSESLDFLNHLCDVNRDVPMLVLAFTRPTLFERRTDWPNTSGVHQRIDLHPLDPRASRLLADELLKKLPDGAGAIADLLIHRAEGNPFYMEELVKMLIDQGVILNRSEDGETWAVNTLQLPLARVPTTLAGVLQARLDGLPAAERRALQQASIVGTVFWDQALAAVEVQAAEQLPALVQRELALPRVEVQLEGLREFNFHHQLLHQVTYDTVLKRAKREGHAKVAQWLAGLSAQGGLRADDMLGLAAEHFELAGDAGQAAEFHARAAEQAGSRQAHARVLAHVGRALALLAGAAPAAVGTPDEVRWRLLKVREKSLDMLGRREEQADSLEAMAQLAEVLNDNHRRAHVAVRRCHRASRMDDGVAQEHAAHQGLDWATKAGNERLRLHALRHLASARVSLGDAEAGQALALQGLAQARTLGLRDIEARMLNVLSEIADQQGDTLGSLDMDRQNLQISREIGDRVNEAIGMVNLGLSWLYLGDLAQARHDIDAALQLLRSNGDRVTEGGALCQLAMLSLWQGDAAQALALAHQALEISSAAQARRHVAIAWLRLGEAELALGRCSAARQAFEQALALAIAIQLALQHDASTGLARVALAEGDLAAALNALQPVLNHAAAGGSLEQTDGVRRIELTCHQALADAGDQRADDWLIRAHTALMAQADAIPDATLRQGFLQNIPRHREILAAWALRHQADGGAQTLAV